MAARGLASLGQLIGLQSRDRRCRSTRNVDERSRHAAAVDTPYKNPDAGDQSVDGGHAEGQGKKQRNGQRCRQSRHGAEEKAHGIAHEKVDEGRRFEENGCGLENLHHSSPLGKAEIEEHVEEKVSQGRDDSSRSQGEDQRPGRKEPLPLLSVRTPVPAGQFEEQDHDR